MYFYVSDTTLFWRRLDSLRAGHTTSNDPRARDSLRDSLSPDFIMYVSGWNEGLQLDANLARCRPSLVAWNAHPSGKSIRPVVTGRVGEEKKRRRHCSVHACLAHTYTAPYHLLPYPWIIVDCSSSNGSIASRDPKPDVH